MNRRELKKLFIIRKARETFLAKGLFYAVMDDISVSAGLSRRSLYRYFETKEDLAYAVCILLLEEWNQYIKEVHSKLLGTGLERLDSFLIQLTDHMAERNNIMKYIGEFDFYFQDERRVQPSEASISHFNEIILVSDTILAELLKEGRKDLSIKADFDIPLMVATISNVLWSFAQRIAIGNRQIQRETGFSGIEIIKFQISLYISVLKEQ